MHPSLRLSSVAALLLVPSLAVAAPPRPRAADVARAEAAFDALVDRYYAEYVAARPTDGTALGRHEHDAELEDLSTEALAKEGERLHRWRGELHAFATAPHGPRLSPARAIDLSFLRASVDAQLLALEEIRPHRRRPDLYLRIATASVYVIIKRDFAPAEARLRSVIAREEQIPRLLHDAEKNLDAVAKVGIAIALEELPGIRSFFKTDVPKAFADVKDKALLARLDHVGASVEMALGVYQRFLEKDLAPRANGRFALGEKLFRAQLSAEEMIDTPTAELLARGEAELSRLQREFQETAKKIDPARPFAEVQRALGQDHPTGAQVIPETQARLAALRKFVVEKRIATIPSEVMPRVQETPPFMRATTFASMDTPGPFESHATEAYYNETLPDAAWPKAKVDEFLEGYSRPLVDVVSIHEAFPGHYVQFLWMPKLASTVRKYESATANSEGWAHYCEQMMLDEGFGDGSPRIRLMQLQDALLRAARYVVAIKMHTQDMTLDAAIDFFQKQGYQTRSIAEMEAKRGTEDPMYLAYTLGKLEILKLRDEYKAKHAADYSIGKFHDALLAEGAIPLPLLRRALLQ